jgi:hypothetical protein
VKLSKEKLEGEFIALLGRLRPSPETVSEFPRIAAQVWAQTQRDTEKTVKRLTQHLVEQKRLKGELLRAKLRGEVPQEDYQQANLEFAEEICHRITARVCTVPEDDHRDVSPLRGASTHGHCWSLAACSR